MTVRTYLADTGYWLMVWGTGSMVVGATFALVFSAVFRASTRVSQSRTTSKMLRHASLHIDTASNSPRHFSPIQPSPTLGIHGGWGMVAQFSRRAGSAPGAASAMAVAIRWFARIITGPRYLDQADDLIQRSGLDNELKASDVGLVSGLGSLAAALLLLSVLTIWHMDARAALPALVVGAFIGARVPVGMLRRRARARRRRLQRDVVSMFDMLALATSAGLSFDRAVEEYSRRTKGELAHLMAAAHARWMSGAVSRESALSEIARAVDLDAFSRITAALVQSIALGSALSSAIESYAQDVREQRRNAIEEEIGKAPVKMLLPLGGCILPAMLILLFTPILAQVFDGLSGGW